MILWINLPPKKLSNQSFPFANLLTSEIRCSLNLIGLKKRWFFHPESLLKHKPKHQIRCNPCYNICNHLSHLFLADAICFWNRMPKTTNPKVTIRTQREFANFASRGSEMLLRQDSRGQGNDQQPRPRTQQQGGNDKKWMTQCFFRFLFCLFMSEQ